MYRSPEATARLISTGGKGVRIEFKGTFCDTCGFYDYFDDYEFYLKRLD
jgi:hypothetical protein